MLEARTSACPHHDTKGLLKARTSACPHHDTKGLLKARTSACPHHDTKGLLPCLGCTAVSDGALTSYHCQSGVTMRSLLAGCHCNLTISVTLL